MASIFWNVSTSGDWNVASNWKPETVPGAGDDAVLGVTGFSIVQSYTVTVTASIDVNSITFADADAELLIQGPVSVTVATNVNVNPGVFDVNSSGHLSVTDDFSVASTGSFSVDGGGGAAIGAALTNNGSVNIGDANLSAPTTVTAASLDNTGAINIAGNRASGTTDDATLSIDGSAPSTWTGSLNISGAAVLKFASGSIGAIASGSEITLGGGSPGTGAKSFIADASDPTSDGALAGLTDISGDLSLRDSVNLALSGALDVQSGGGLYVDNSAEYGVGADGGSALTIGGSLSGAGGVTIGNSDLSSPTTVTLGGSLDDDTGTINLDGNFAAATTEQATLDVKGAAPSTVTGSINVGGDGLLEFGSGGITSIAAGGEITLGGGSPGTGAQSRIALASATGSNSALTKLASLSGAFSMRDGADVTLSGPLDVSSTGGLFVDNSAEYGVGADGGSTLSIGGSLTNAATTGGSPTGVVIGNSDLSSSTTVTVNGTLDNTGTVDVTGNGSSTTTDQATLDVTGAAPTTVSGSINVSGDGLLEFGSGGIDSIAAGAEITLGGGSPGTGVQSRIALAGATNSNSALSKLASLSGAFSMRDGADVTLSGPLDVSSAGGLFVDNSAEYGVGADGGSSLTIGGSLTNAATTGGSPTGVVIGNADLSSSTTVKVDGSLDNTGTVDLTGNWAKATTDQATLDVTGAAPTSWEGSLNLSGDALLEFGSGSIEDISSGAEISIGSGQPGAGVQSFIADASDPTANGALSGLATIEGDLELEDGAAVTLTGNLTNSGTLGIDDQRFPYPNNTGGSSLKIDGAWTNSGTADIGVASSVAPTTVSAASINDTGGTINLLGNYTSGSTNQATLDITGAAPTSWTGALNVSGDALVEFGSGSITDIASTGSISLGGAASQGGPGEGLHSFIADASDLTANGALSGLASNQGTLRLEDGVTVKLSGAFANSSTLLIDDEDGYWYNSGASMLAIAGAFTNSGTATIGNGSLIAPTEVTAASLDDSATGVINLVGNWTSGTTERTTLDIAGAAQSSWSGTLNVTGDALLEFGSGSITSIASTGTISLGGLASSGGAGVGLQSFIADASDPTANGALSGLASNAGTLRLENGVTLKLSGAFDNGGTVLIDDENGYWYNSGGSTLAIAGAFTNSGTADIGNGSLIAPTEVTAASLDDSATGVINLAGNWTSGTTERTTLDIAGAAPTTWSGTLNVTGDALLEFGSGSIVDIASTGSISLGGLPISGGAGVGAQSFIADASDPTANGALSGLANNAGTLRLEDGVVVALAGSFENSGTLLLDDEDGYWYRSGGSTLTIAGAFTNSGAATFGNNSLTSATDATVGSLNNQSGGKIIVSAASDLSGSLKVLGAATNAGAITINAYGEIGVSGKLTDSGSLTDGGVLDLGGAMEVTGSGSLSMQGGSVVTSSGQTLTLDAGATVSGYGAVDVAIVNLGTITANGGLLDLTDAITGAGQLGVATGSEMELGAATAEAFSFNGHVGTLKLDHPSEFTGAIDGLVAGDTIDLAGVQATSAIVSGSTLTVKAGSQTFTYQVAGSGLSGNTFAIQSDQNGGTDLVLGAPGPTISGPTTQTAFLGWPTVLGPLTIADPNAGNGLLTVTITAQKGTLSGVDTSGNPLPGNGTNQLTLTGTLADINTMLASVLYHGVTAGATDNVQVAVKDASNATAAQTIAVTTGTVPYTALVLNAPSVEVLVAGAFTALGGINVSDPSAQVTGETLSVESEAGATQVANGTGGVVTGQNTNNITITGTVAQINGYFADDDEVEEGAVSLNTALKIIGITSIFSGTANIFKEILKGGPPNRGPVAEAIKMLDEQIAAMPNSSLVPIWNVEKAVLIGICYLLGLPNIITYSGDSYSFGAVGEFVIAKSIQPSDSFQVQARFEPYDNSASVTALTAIAAEVGNDSIMFVAGGTSVLVNGVSENVSPATGLLLPGGTITQPGPTTYIITWSTGEILTVVNEGYTLNLSLSNSDTVLGLANDEFVLPNGTTLPQPLTSAELNIYANAWRVTDSTSLFYYAAGQDTATFTNTKFQAAAVTLADLPTSIVALATQVVAATGITDPGAVAAMEFDYIASGGNVTILANDESAYQNVANQGVTTTPTTITQSSTPPAMVGVFAPVNSVLEPQTGSTDVTFDVYLTATEATATTVDYSVIDPNPDDFAAAAFGGMLPTGSITIAAGQKTGTITIAVQQGALGSLPSKDVALQISSPGDDVPIFAPTSVEAVSSATATAPSSGGAAAAKPQLDYLGTLGTFTQSGDDYVLNLGDIIYGETLPSLQFAVANAASSPGDSLSGSFTWPTVAGFDPSVDGSTTSGASLASAIAAGSSDQALTVNLVQDKFGGQSETITYDPVDTNASGYSKQLSPITLTIDDTLEVPGTMYSRAFGDVHILTYAGETYNFQAAGEFTLAKSQLADDSFDIQIRLQPETTSSTVTLITQTAVSLGDDDITFDTDGGTEPITVRDDGKVTTLSMSNPTLKLASGTITEVSPAMYQVDWSTGETMTVTAAQWFSDGGEYYLDVSDSAPDVPGSVVGLQPGDDLPSTTCDLYGSYADEWRVTQATSLFYYTLGETTATFTVPGFPSDQVSLADIPASVLAQAQAAVAAAGITDPNLVQDAELDYLATGSLEEVNASANVNQQVNGTSAATITPCTTPTTAIGVMAAATKVTEAASGLTAVTFTAYLTGTESTNTTVDYAVTAPSAGFFGASSFGGSLPTGSVDIAAGQTEAQFTINLPQGALGSIDAEDLEVQVLSPADALPVFAPTATTEVDNDKAEAGAPAQAVLAYLGTSGTFSYDAATHTYTLNLGGVVEGSAIIPAQFAVVNAATGAADSLSGTFTAPTGEGYTVTGDNLPSALAAGEDYEGLYISVNTAELGANGMSLTFDPEDVNNSGYSAALTPLTLKIVDFVTAAAKPQVNTPTTIIFPNARVGANDSQHVSVTNTATSGAADLDVTLSASGDATASGAVTDLAPGSTNADDLSVGIDTSTAGAQSGSVTENFVSDAGGGVTSPISEESPYVDVFGSVYRPAAPSISVTPTIVHVGDPGTASLTVSNTAAADGYSENLVATLAGVTGATSLTAGETTGEIAAGSSVSMPITFSTATAAQYNASAVVDLTSDGGTGSGSIDGLGQLALAPQSVSLDIAVDNYAEAELVETSGGGAFTQNGTDYTLNLGTITQGSSPVVIDLAAKNAASGPADLLSGDFAEIGDDAFANALTAVSGIGGDQSAAAGTVTLSTSTTGGFTETITFDPTGSNASGYSGVLPNERLTITGVVAGSAAPALGFNSPVSFSSPTTATFTGSVAEIGGSIKSVALYNGAVDAADLIGDAAISGTTWSLTATLPAGKYAALQAVATDAKGQTTTVAAPYKLVTGVTNNAFAAEEYDYSQGKLIGRIFFNADGSVYLADELSTDPTTQGLDEEFTRGSFFSTEPYKSFLYKYSASGLQLTQSYFNADGTTYLFSTAHALAYGATAFDFTAGSALTGAAWSSYEYDYDAGDVRFESKFFYTSVPAGADYASAEYDYNGAGLLIRAAYSDLTDAPYSSYEYDFIGGVFEGSKFTYTSVPNGASYSSYEVDYGYTSAFAGEKFFYSNVTGEPYTGEEIDFDANLDVSRIVLTGVSDQAYSALVLDYDAGTYEGYKAYYTITGQSYTEEEVVVSASNQLEKVIYSGMTSTPYSSVEEDYSNGSIADVIYNFTGVANPTYDAYQITENPGGNALSEVFDLSSGGHTQIALASGQTLTSQGNDKFTGSATGATTFALDPIYGADTITNLTSADTVSMSTSEFADFAALQKAAVQSGANVIVTASDGDTLTLKNITLSTLAGLSNSFTFSA